MADAATRRPSRCWRFAAVAAVAATAGALAGCGGQSGRDQVAAVARAYDRALLTGNGRVACSLISTNVRRELLGSTAQAPCAQFISLNTRTVSSPHPVVTDVLVHGVHANATVRSAVGVAIIPLSREAGRWRVAGRVHYIRRNWLQADYRVSDAGGLSASAIASILDSRARTIIGALVRTRAIGRDEVRLAVAEPARLADLTPVTRREQGRLAFYDWEANALTPTGKPVSEELRSRDPAAMLISQGSGAEPPGTTGGLPLRAAVKLAAAQRPVAGADPSQRQVRGVPRGWMLVAGQDPGAGYFVLRDRAALTRSDITDAYVTFDARGRPAIGIRFTSDGARAFQRLTAVIARRGAMLSSPQLAVNQHLAAVVDGKLVSVIFVNYHVYPHGIPSLEATDISGGFTPAAAYELANTIAARPLPADLQLLRATTYTRPASTDRAAAGTTGPRQRAGPA